MRRHRQSKLMLESLLGLLLVVMSARVGLGEEFAQRANGTDLPAIQRALEAFVVPLAESGDLSGTLLVASDGIVIFERAFGMADFELGVSNTPSTRYGIASLAKPLTALICFHLVETGKLRLDDRLARWIPDFPRGDEITVDHLLRHRSGLPHRVTTRADEVEPQDPASMTTLAARAELLFDPGSASAYSSAGYSVLARVLELAAGRSYAELLETVVLAPAGAVHTVHPHGHGLVSRRAQSYLRGARGPIRAESKELSFLVGAGSLYSTARDVFAIQRQLLSGGYGELATTELAGDEGNLSWSGITNGFRAFASHDGETGVAIVFTGNLFTGAADLLRDGLHRIATGAPVATPALPSFEVAAVPPTARIELEGIYQLRPGSTDSEEPLRFEGEIARLGDWVLIPVGSDQFISPQDYATVRVVRSEQGAVESLVWGEGESAPQFPRVGPLP